MPKKPSCGLHDWDIEHDAGQNYELMNSIVHNMINTVGVSIIEEIKTVCTWKDVPACGFHRWEVDGAWLFYCKCNYQGYEKYSRKDAGVLLSWKSNHGGCSKYLLPHFLVVHSFIIISNAHPSILAGQALMAVTRRGKVYKDNTQGIRQLADHITDSGMNDLSDVGISDESKEENDDIDADSDSEEYILISNKSLFMTMMEVQMKMTKQQIMTWKSIC